MTGLSPAESGNRLTLSLGCQCVALDPPLDVTLDPARAIILCNAALDPPRDAALDPPRDVTLNPPRVTAADPFCAVTTPNPRGAV